MFNRLTKILCFLFSILLISALASAAELEGEGTIGSDVRSSDYIIYGDLTVNAISKDKTIKGKLKVIEMLKGKIDKEALEVNISMQAPNNSFRLNSDLTNLNISASEDIERSGSSSKRVIAMIRNAEGKDEVVRLAPFFRADKLDLYVDSYKEIVRMTQITDEKKLLNAIKHNLVEDGSYVLYTHCIDELFKIHISFNELFLTINDFLDYKGEKKTSSWFNFLRRAGERLYKDYEKVDKNGRESFFRYLYDYFSNEPIESEYTNKLFLELIYDFRGLISKDAGWKAKFYKGVEEKEFLIKSGEEDNYRVQKLQELRKKVMHALSKEE